MAVVITSLSLLAGAAAGCSTTQEKAEKQQARAEHILGARKERQDQKKKQKHGKSGHENKKGGA
ncbi:MAG TPA: hypothetical protein VLL27_02365 [Solirubrobacterales bacterium]|nr:hypothetical protein [Solirubrobacterales bacterium]